MATTRLTLRQQLGFDLGWMDTGTFTAIDTSTADDSARQDDDALWNGGYLNVTTAARAQERRIQTWTQSTTRFAIYGSFSPAIVVADAYEAWRYLTAVQVNQCILEAIRRAAPHIYQDLSNATVSITGGTYTITVPSSFRNHGLTRVEVLEAGSGTPILTVAGWRYRGDGTTLELPEAVVDQHAGLTLRLWGVGMPTEPGSDTATVELDQPEVNIVILGAKARAVEKRMQQEPLQNQEKLLPLLHIARADYRQAILDYGKRPEYMGPPQHDPWAS